MNQSLGGLLAVNFGLLYPEATKSLILADSALDGFIFSSEFLEPFGDIEACAKRGDVKVANQLWLNHTLFAPLNPTVGATEKILESELGCSQPGRQFLFLDRRDHQQLEMSRISHGQCLSPHV